MGKVHKKLEKILLLQQHLHLLFNCLEPPLLPFNPMNLAKLPFIPPTSSTSVPTVSSPNTFNITKMFPTLQNAMDKQNKNAISTAEKPISTPPVPVSTESSTQNPT